MIKKNLVVLLAAGMLASMTACGTDKKPEADNAKEQMTAESSVEETYSALPNLGEFSIEIEENEEGAFAP